MAEQTPLPPGSDVLLLEDDPGLRKRCAAYLRTLGATVTEAGKIEEARRLLRDARFDFALIDLHLPDGEALELLREGAFSENTGVVVMTAFGGVKKAVEAMRLGAGDYLAKPFETEELPLAFLRCRETRIAKRREEYSREQLGHGADHLFFGASLGSVRTQVDAILATERRLEHALPPVLIEGETGTGKTVLARWLHRQGPRSNRPMLSVNCAALPENLAESELFGHERGAFTDARQARTGLFEAADGGTLFLDEVASLSPAVQAKLLTAVEDRTIRRVGSNREMQLDVHLIAASNRPLADLVAAGQFRDDLYQRLNLLHLTLPPLRERGRDVIELARHLLGRIAKRHRMPDLHITTDGEARLIAQPWRGNVRELAHELERAVIFGQSSALDFAHFGAPPVADGPAWRNPAWRLPESGFAIDAVVEDLISEALRETDNNVSAAARRLGVTREFLRYRLNPEKRAGGTAEVQT
jgi:DNA-binding NtrC family response regulator